MADATEAHSEADSNETVSFTILSENYEFGGIRDTNEQPGPKTSGLF